MEDGKTKYKSAKTRREYKITCESTHILYLAHCRLCNIDYIGKIIRSMRARYLGHRSEIRSGADGFKSKK